MISVHPVGEHGVVSDDEGEGAAWGCELAIEPVPLSGFVRGAEVERLGC